MPKQVVTGDFNGLKIAYRQKTWDAGIVWEVLHAYPLHRCECREIAVIVDIGSHIGTFTAWCMRKWPQARFIAVEPDPNNYVLTVRNCYGAVCLQAAAGNPENGPVSVIRYKDNVDHAPHPTHNPSDWGPNTGGSFVAKSPGQLPADREDVGEVPTLSLHQICDHLPGWRREGMIDLLKMDCEGAEIDVLTYAGLPMQNIRYILGEVHGAHRQQALQDLLESTHKLEFTKPGAELSEFFAERI